LTKEQAEGFQRFMSAYLDGKIEVIDMTDEDEAFHPVYLGANEHDTRMFEEVAPKLWNALKAQLEQEKLQGEDNAERRDQANDP
jgi:hypothetical protein